MRNTYETSLVGKEYSSLRLFDQVTIVAHRNPGLRPVLTATPKRISVSYTFFLNI
jgi:hypothetical protein